MSLEWTLLFHVGRKQWLGCVGRRGYSQSQTEHVFPRLSVLHGGRDMLTNNEIYFCPPFKPYSYICMYIDI